MSKDFQEVFVVIGAGAVGLAAALKLSKAGKTVVVLESSSSIGGAARSVKKDGFEIEAFYHHFFHKDLEIQELIKEYGLQDKLSWKVCYSGWNYFGKEYKFSNPMDIFSFKPFSILDHASAAATQSTKYDVKPPNIIPSCPCMLSSTENSILASSKFSAILI